MWAMEELETNWEWFEGKLGELGGESEFRNVLGDGGVERGKTKRADLRRVVEDYVLFDCPGQVELFTHHESLRNIFFRIQKFGYRVRFSLFSLAIRISPAEVFN